MAKRNKNQKLIKKIEILLKRLEAETNPIKRALYTVKLEHLNARLQKEINIINIKERFEHERKERIEELNKKREERTQEKVDIILNRNTYAGILGQMSDFDPKSPNFAFKEELDIVGGDVDKLIEYQENKGNIDLAKRIRDAVYARTKYEKAKENIEDIKSQGKKMHKEVRNENIKSSIRENALIIKEKTNIFKRIYNAIKAGIDEYKKTREANLLYETEKMSIQAKITGRKNREIGAVNDQYEVEMAKIQALIEEINAGREEVISRINKKYNNQLLEELDNKSNFRLEMRNEEAANRVNKIVEKFNSKQIEQKNEEPTQETEHQEERQDQE